MVGNKKSRKGEETPVPERFAPKVLAFEVKETPKGGKAPRFLYDLQADLLRLERNQRAQDPDAVVVFCARILEVTALRAMVFAPKEAGLKLTENTFSNLQQLQKQRILPATTATWAHGVRMLGNAARHFIRPIKSEDADLAVAFLEGYLDWFFCEYQYQHRAYKSDRLLADLVEPPAFAADTEVLRLVDMLKARPPRLSGLLQAAGSEKTPFYRSPVFATMTAEKLLAEGLEDKAVWVLRQAVKHDATYEEDFRLRQMMGLYYSRRGKLDKAEKWLTGGAKAEEFGREEETVGILGGVYKRRYLAALTAGSSDLRARPHLHEATRTYERGWKASEFTNFYLGINAAALSLWNGDLYQARGIAKSIVSRLGHLKRRVAKVHGSFEPHFDLWDELTLLEAELILGQFDEVKQSVDAMVADPKLYRRKDINVFLGQSRRNVHVLRELGETELPDDYLGPDLEVPEGEE